MTSPAPSVTSAPPSATATALRPLFGGYALVAAVAAWLVGIALRGIGPLAGIAPPGWLIAAGVALLVWVGSALLGHLAIAARAPRTIRALLMGGLLAFFVALGAARAASADPTMDPYAVSRFATGQSVRLQGEVAAEPDLRDGARILTVEVSQVSTDGGHTWQPATGRVEATVSGPDDWFSPAYGDGVSLTGTLRPLGSGYAPAGVLARLTGVRATVIARGGGNPLLAWLFNLRLQLAQAIQRALPEPEAALLIGILLGLKTPVLRARLPLLVPPIQRRLAVPLRRLPLGNAAAELLAVTLAAQLATLPVLALTFHQLSLVAPLANLLTVPLLAPLVVLGTLLAFAGLLPSAWASRWRWELAGCSGRCSGSWTR